MHVGKVFVTCDEYVGICHAGQFEQIIILRVAAVLWNVSDVIVLAADTEECEQAVAGFWGEVSGELRTRGHGHDFIP